MVKVRKERAFGSIFYCIPNSYSKAGVQSTMCVHSELAKIFLDNQNRPVDPPTINGLTVHAESVFEGYKVYLVSDTKDRWVTCVGFELNELTSGECTIEDDYRFFTATVDEMVAALKTAIAE